MDLTTLTLIGACSVFAVGTLLYFKSRKRLINGRMPIDIDFDQAKRMENKYR